MFGQEAVQDILKRELAERQLRNPSYSIRAFAQSLRVSPSALSEILRGKRRISKERALKLVDALSLSPQEQRRVIGLFETPDSEGQIPPVAYQELRSDQFSAVADWQHFAILSLAETKGFTSEIKWISRRLGISPLLAEQSLVRLERLGLVKKIRGQWKVSGQSFTSSDGIADSAIKKSHANDLRLAERSLLEDDIEDRDFTSVTMAVDPKKIPDIRKLVRSFRDKITAYAESGEKKEVYKLCVQLIPITRDNLSQNKRR